MAKLILSRHGTTDWNKEGKWHGWSDIPVNEEGRQQARTAAESIKDIEIAQAFVSKLQRTQQTCEEIADVLGQKFEITEVEALNERNYGIYTGKNKWEVKEEIGDEAFQTLRRSWDAPVPEGESLKQVYDRVVPFYEETVLPLVKEGKNILIVSSGNTLRALMKHLKQMTNEQIAEFEIGFSEINVFDIDSEGQITHHETRAKDLFKGKQ